MQKQWITGVKSHLKMLITGTLLLAGVQQANAQSLTYGTLYYGDPVSGSSNTATNAVLNIGSGLNLGSTYLKPVGAPTSMAADANGNLAIGFNSGNRINRIDNGSGKATIFQTGAITYNSLGIDKQNEYIYYAGTGTIQRSIWANTGANTSVGFYSGAAAGTATTNVKAIPFLTTGDLVYFNGSASLSAFTFGSVRAIAFDTNGNLYYADNTNHAVRKISIVKQTVSSTMLSGASSLTLTDVSGIVVGDLVSGINIPASTYVGSVNVGTKTITLTQSNLTTARTITADIDNTATLAFITGIDHIAGTAGTASATAATLGGPAGTTGLSFNATSWGIGLTFDATGNLYVTDQAWSRVLKIEATGGFVNSSSIISNFMSTNVTNGAAGLAVDNLGKVYVARRSSHNVARSTGVVGETETVIGSGTGRITITSGTASSGSVTVTGIPAATVTALKVGMILKSTTNFVVGTQVVAKPTTTSITISIPAIATAGSIASTIATTEDGYVSGIGAASVGSVDGPATVVIANNNIYLPESTGNFVRVLTSITTLPVTLSKEFTAKLAGSAVNLNWTSASEQNNKEFIVKRSADAVNYSLLKTVDSKGADGATYATADFNPLNGDNYYQLSQVDNDGTTKVLGTQVVKVALKSAPFTIYPNPVQTSSFTINAPSATSTSVIVKITDMGGKQIYNHSFTKTDDGKYEIQLSVKPAVGVYIISVNNTEAQKLIIK